MLSESKLGRCIRGNNILPCFLGPEDLFWLERLKDEFSRFDGQPIQNLLLRLKQPFTFKASDLKLKLAVAIMLKIVKNSDKKPLAHGKAIRELLFKAVHKYKDHNLAIQEAANAFELKPSEISDLLFSDLANHRHLQTQILETMTSTELALQANLLLARLLIGRSRQVRIEMWGQSRPVIRHAKLRGLICVVEKSDSTVGFTLIVSGPLSILRKTMLYGRHLGELLPFLQRCDRYSLEAICLIKDKECVFKLSSGAPLPPPLQTDRFDSQLEKKFYRAFLKSTTNWDLIREPEPVSAQQRWIFPDFEVRHRNFPERHWMIEIVGFWSPDYLEDKLKKLQQAAIANLIICLDATKACGQGEGWLRLNARVVIFHKTIDPQAILSIIETSTTKIIQ